MYVTIQLSTQTWFDVCVYMDRSMKYKYEHMYLLIETPAHF